MNIVLIVNTNNRTTIVAMNNNKPTLGLFNIGHGGSGSFPLSVHVRASVLLRHNAGDKRQRSDAKTLAYIAFTKMNFE